MNIFGLYNFIKKNKAPQVCRIVKRIKQGRPHNQKVLTIVPKRCKAHNKAYKAGPIKNHFG